MVYTLTTNGGDLGPEFSGYREFWQKSYGGAHVADYDAGVALGREDLENEDSEGFAYLDGFNIVDRDLAWEAQMDGYRYTTRERGPTKYG